MVRGSHMPGQPGQKTGHHMSAIRPVLTSTASHGGMKHGGSMYGGMMHGGRAHGGMKHGGGVGKRKHHKKSFHKGSRSRTMKGKLDFTTKRGDKVFHAHGKIQRRKRKPFMKK